MPPPRRDEGGRVIGCRPLAIGLVAAALTALLWVANCSGPRPALEGTRLREPEQPGDAYRLEASVRNAGPGHGEVSVLFRLVDPISGDAYEEQKQVQLERGETTRVVAEIMAPLGTYEPKVEVEYPRR